jgi:hypothetical protein
VRLEVRSDGLNRLHGLGEYAAPVVADDRFRIDPTADPTSVAASSGRDLKWPQLGIGIAFLVVLGLGAYLVVRPGERPLAH